MEQVRVSSPALSRWEYCVAGAFPVIYDDQEGNRHHDKKRRRK